MARLVNKLATRLVAFLSVILIGITIASPALAQSRTQNGANPKSATPAPLATPAITPKTSVQPYLDQVVKNISEFQLSNGMKFIVLERHNAPVISFRTYVDVGGADENPGKTGISHFLEHLAFKGTTRIGTQDFAKEKVLLDRQDKLWETLKAAQKSNNLAEVEKLQTEFKALDAELLTISKQNEFGQIIERSGGVGLNATTAADATNYFFSFPSNKLELWMSLESDRFLDPILREFFKEKAVIQEERRMRIDNSPIGKLIEEYLPAAFKVHPYRQPVAGYAKDIESMNRADIQAFFQKYYTPNNITISIVGDVNSSEVKTLAETYFGRFKAKAVAKKVDRTLPIEPAQTETRTVKLSLPSEPIYLEGYHRPALGHPDNAIYEAIASLLSDGRTSRLYKSLVESQKIALTAEGFNGFPGDKFPNLIMFYALSAPGHSVEEIQKGIDTEIQRLKTDPVTQMELDRIKTNARAGLLRSLSSNSGMASALVEYQVKTGTWRNLFNQLDAISAITPADIQRVAKSTFRPENKTIGEIVSDRSP
ncbi:MAG: pitrilysin family protein [Cyanobacteria bacterium]|nr:pitrilysin family protein [Cyanobacteriota bacterium]